MRQLSSELLEAYRKHTFSLLPELRVKTINEAVDFVNDRGFIFFWPIRTIPLPSLWMAAAGERSVASNHDDPAHITWTWKDSLLGSRQWYYAKVLRRKSTMISFELAPYFYALSENYGAFEDDYLTLYEQGHLTLEAKNIYETILRNGPLDTVHLRRLTHLSAPSSENRFNRAISDLQSGFKILPVGVTESGAWRYAFSYDIVARYYPEIPLIAQNYSEQIAIQKLIWTYARLLGAIDFKSIQHLFGWHISIIEKAIDVMLLDSRLLKIPKSPVESGDWLVVPDIFL
jgi:hypothetical protein